MLRDADRRVAEIVTLCSAHATGHHITLLSLRLNLEPVRSIFKHPSDFAEIDSLCLKVPVRLSSMCINTGHPVTTKLRPARAAQVPKLAPFVAWLTKDKQRVWKRFDKDKSGTMDLGELEAALEM